MRRRAFVAGTAFAALLPLGVGAQAPRKIARIGMLWHAGSAEEERPYLEAVHRGLRDFGYVEGANLIADYRYPNEEPERFRSMAAELVALKPGVLLAAGAAAAVAAKNSNSTIPVVFIAGPHPIAGSTSLKSSAARAVRYPAREILRPT